MRITSLLMLAAFATPALAARTPAPGGDLRLAQTVVHARLAGMLGQEERQATLLGEAARAVPDDRGLALSAMRSATLAGDQPLAVRALAALPAEGPRPADALLLQLADATTRHDPAAQDAALARIGHDAALGQVAAILRAWVTLDRGGADPAAALANAPAAVRSYADEARALILLARGQAAEGVAALQPLLAPAADGASAREVRLRVAAAAALARAGDRANALRMAAGADPALALTRAAIRAGGIVPDAIDTPARGLADTLDLLAADIARGRPPAIALSIARIATFLAPEQARPWLILGSLQALSGAAQDGVATLAHVPSDSAFVPAARALKVRLLVRAGDNADAIKAAQAAAASPDATSDDWTVLGEAQAASGNQRDAAAAFLKARAVEKRGGAPEGALWRYDLMAGGALEQAGDWRQAEPLLARAVKLAPDQPEALNYLGYARIDRREDVAASTKLIEQAHAMDPDSGAITDSLGWARFLTGDIVQAVPTLEQAAAEEPGDPEINEHLGDAYWAAGRLYEARYAWRAASVYADPDKKARLAAKIANGPSPAT